MILVLYSFATFLSALLLFSIQPAMGKLIIPSFGGTPAVWNSCVLFFQAVVFLGYLYANVLASRIAPRKQFLIHSAIVLLPFLLSNILLSNNLRVVDGNPILQIIYFLSAAVGANVFALSATTPLLQHWFGCSEHVRREDPYFLYVASNIGSLFGLLCYPFLWERNWELSVQLQHWNSGYVLFAAVIGGCIALIGLKVFNKPVINMQGDLQSQKLDSLTRKSRLLILFGGFVPSSYLLGVTVHVVTNVAAVPLLWVIPLALYLISFTVAFSRFGGLTYRLVGRSYLFFALPMTYLMFGEVMGLGWIQVLFHFTLFFLACLLCHAAVALIRPPVQQLTEFYVLLSVGGLLGGVFNTILVPVIFVDTWEYPLALAGSFALLPGVLWNEKKRLKEELRIPLLVGAGVVCVVFISQFFPGQVGKVLGDVCIGIALFVAYTFRTKIFRLLLTYSFVLAGIWLIQNVNNQALIIGKRNFYGVKKVVDHSEKQLRILVHGNTHHGAESLDPAKKGIPLTYFHANGPVGDVFHWLRSREDKTPVTIAVVGLGVGAMVAYAEPEDLWTLYELDPEIVQIAENENYFSFLANSKAPLEIIVGDGRQELQHRNDRYDIIFLDAFSSDAVPTHLLTQEAIQLYLQHLKEGGLLVFNVSNRFLDIASVIYRAAQSLSLHAISRADLSIPEDELDSGRYQSHYVIVAKNKDTLDFFRGNPAWSIQDSPREIRVWTDQYSAIGALFY